MGVFRVFLFPVLMGLLRYGNSIRIVIGDVISGGQSAVAASSNSRRKTKVTRETANNSERQTQTARASSFPGSPTTSGVRSSSQASVTQQPAFLRSRFFFGTTGACKWMRLGCRTRLPRRRLQAFADGAPTDSVRWKCDKLRPGLTFGTIVETRKRTRTKFARDLSKYQAPVFLTFFFSLSLSPLRALPKRLDSLDAQCTRVQNTERLATKRQTDLSLRKHVKRLACSFKKKKKKFCNAFFSNSAPQKVL